MVNSLRNFACFRLFEGHAEFFLFNNIFKIFLKFFLLVKCQIELLKIVSIHKIEVFLD